METFAQIAKDVYLLKVPFGPVWTGVILLRGEENILIDSSATGADVDKHVVPALKKMVEKSCALTSMVVVKNFFIPIGEQPP